MTRQAVVLIPACSNLVGNHQHPSHTVQRKYSDAVFYGANCTPLLIPAMGAALDVDVLLDLADGIFLSGSPSNVGAALYGEEVTQPQLPQDALRDDLTLPLIKGAVARGMPIFGVCRGFQEMNVALGGTLHQAVHDVPELDRHIAVQASNAEEQYGYSHPAYVAPDGLLHEIIGKQQLMVNSVHGQGIKQLAAGLTAQATAPDGLVEAFTIDAHPSFGLAVQWHPEWKMHDNPDSVALFAAFGDACRAYQNT
ncbi:MAG: gamma-glutamyl-gamma-aminobutyrate hydrolase family protein [Formosimonas sp.]